MDDTRITPDTVLVTSYPFVINFTYNVEGEEVALIGKNSTIASITVFNSGLVVGNKLVSTRTEPCHSAFEIY